MVLVQLLIWIFYNQILTGTEHKVYDFLCTREAIYLIDLWYHFSSANNMIMINSIISIVQINHNFSSISIKYIYTLKYKICNMNWCQFDCPLFSKTISTFYWICRPYWNKCLSKSKFLEWFAKDSKDYNSFVWVYYLHSCILKNPWL